MLCSVKLITVVRLKVSIPHQEIFKQKGNLFAGKNKQILLAVETSNKRYHIIKRQKYCDFLDFSHVATETYSKYAVRSSDRTHQLFAVLFHQVLHLCMNLCQVLKLMRCLKTCQKLKMINDTGVHSSLDCFRKCSKS